MKTKLSLWITLAILGLLAFSLLAPPVKNHKRQGAHIQCVNAAPHILISFPLTNTAAGTLPGPRQ